MSAPTLAASTTLEVVMHRLSEIIADKGHDIFTIDAEATVYDAVKAMVAANVGALLVTVDGELTGLITERDYLRRVTLEGRTSKETAVREIMSTPLIVATLDTSVEECMALMTDRYIRHVPVVDEGKVIGVVSIGDLVKFTSQKQSFEIQFLTDFITGG